MAGGTYYTVIQCFAIHQLPETVYRLELELLQYEYRIANGYPAIEIYAVQLIGSFHTPFPLPGPTMLRLLSSASVT